MTTPETRHQCRHIMTGGHRCGSPCLRNQDFCYYHHTTRRPAPLKRNQPGACIDVLGLSPAPHQFQIPTPDDRAAIQLSIGEVLRRIANHEIDPRRAGLLLYGLQIASNNLPKAAPPPSNATIEDITEDPDQGLLAPTAEFTQANRAKTLEEILMQQWERDKATQASPILTPTA